MNRSSINSLSPGKAVITIMLTANLFIISCSGNSGTTPTSGGDSTAVEEEYHADNDIAMTIQSIADAMRMGEPLDSTDYNFEGVLTDGEGRPLYTDIQGSPGVWEVDVISPTSVVIRNIFLGDLLPDYLESYVVASLNLDDTKIIETNEFDDDEETQLVVYDFDGGYLRFETRAAVSPNGLEGPLMSIIATKKAPEGARN